MKLFLIFALASIEGFSVPSWLDSFFFVPIRRFTTIFM